MAERRINRESVRWLILEGTAIVFSILLAFWVEAWWSNRQLLADEQLTLSSIRDDFLVKRRVAENGLMYNEAILDSTRKLLYASTETDHGFSEAEIDKLISDIWWNNSTTLWRSPLLQAMVGNGSISQISNASLRNDLIEWSIRFERIEESISREIQFYDSRLMVFMETHVSMPQILNTVGPAPGLADLTYDYGEDFVLTSTASHSQLLRNQQFQGLLARRSILLNDILVGPLNGLEADLEGMIRDIENELNDKH